MFPARGVAVFSGRRTRADLLSDVQIVSPPRWAAAMTLSDLRATTETTELGTITVNKLWTPSSKPPTFTSATLPKINPATESRIHAFHLLSRLDYCDPVLTGVSARWLPPHT